MKLSKFSIALLLMVSMQIQCSSKGPNLPALGQQFCMDLDNDDYSGVYTRTEEDTDETFSDLTLVTCSASSDCDDTNPLIFSGAIETADNGIDEDCDGLDFTISLPEIPDEEPECEDGKTKLTYYKDTDADGYGDATQTLSECDKPSGYSDLSTDCNDADSSIHPGSTEEVVGDGIDHDCNGNERTSDCETSFSYSLDADGDTFPSSTTLLACKAPNTNYILLETSTQLDCDDSNTYINPGMRNQDYGYLVYQKDPASAHRVLDSIKNRWLVSLSPINPTLDIRDFTRVFTNENGLPEPTSGEGIITNSFLDVDNDCDGVVDEDHSMPKLSGHQNDDYASYVIDDYKKNTGVYYSVCDGQGAFNAYSDNDADGFGADETLSLVCRSKMGTKTLISGDCDDTNAEINPNESDFNNVFGITFGHASIDENCNGTLDEDGAKTGDTWLTSAFLNGLKISFESPDKTSGYSVDLKAESFNGSSENNPSNMELTYKANSFNDKEDFDHTLYFSTFKVNQDLARFWYGDASLENSSRVTTSQNSLKKNFSCDENNYCEGTISVVLSAKDKTNQHTFTTDFINGKEVALFLRGFKFGSPTYGKEEIKTNFVDLSLVAASLDDDVLDTIEFKFKTQLTNKADLSFMPMQFEYTVMVYDPQHIQVAPKDRSLEEFTLTEDLLQTLTLTQISDFELSKLITPKGFDCSEETKDCEDGFSKTIGSALNTFGFQNSVSIKPLMIEARSYLSAVDILSTESNKAEVEYRMTTQGRLVDDDINYPKEPNKTEASFIFCSNKDVCQIKFNIESHFNHAASEEIIKTLPIPF